MLKHRAGKSKKKIKHRRWLEYLVINLFVFASIGLLSLFVLNFAIFDPFTQAFKDFTLTDIYYNKDNRKLDRIYPGPIVMIGVENKTREDIALLLTKIKAGQPKVVGMDIVFAERKDSVTDAFLKQAIDSIPNIVMPYAASFDSLTEGFKTNEYFQTKANAFVNMIGENPEFSTVRNYYPYYHNEPSFSSALIEQYDPSLSAELKKRNNKKTDIKYYGNIQNFRYYSFDEIMFPEAHNSTTPEAYDSTTQRLKFSLDSLKGKIVILGYFGESNVTRNTLDEDRFYTPLNQRLSGRSHPDMYGVVIHANIVRMALDKDYVIEVPTWLNWTIAFLLSWMLIPLFARWYIHKPMWAHFYTKIFQLAISYLFVIVTVKIYPAFNIKLDSGSILVAVLLLGDLVLFYDGLVKFLKTKFKLNFHSIFFEGAHGH